MDAAIRNQRASIKALKIQIEQMSKVLQGRGSRNVPGSTKTNPRDHVKSISTTIKADTTLICRIGTTLYVVSSPRNMMQFFKPRQSIIPFPSRLIDDSYEEKEVLGELIDRMEYATDSKKLLREKLRMANRIINEYMLEDIKVPLILGRPFLSTAHAKIDVFKKKICLRVGNDKIIFKSDKPTSNIIRRVYATGLRERMELDLEARLMGEDLILNRSLDLVYEDYIKLNDLNEPLELMINQVKDLGQTIKEGEIVYEPMEDIVKTRNGDNEISNGINEYPSFCDFYRKIYIDCSYNLQFSCMIGFEHVNVNFFLILSINVMSKRFYNSIMKDKIVCRGKNVVEAFMNVPIFVGNFSVMTDFAVMENMDVYLDQDICEVIMGEPLCREICVKASRFDGMITIYNGNDSVTYQIARSHLRFKHLTNAQHNKMRPLLKVSVRDKLNEMSHPYKKLKSFYKGVLNLEPEYIRDAKIEELLTRGHVRIHEME
uniref:Homeodomain-like protein n=1 Tax=Tanacetum cinerariifolium TaxID=118510 RepID=A0A6L2LJL7_TANCI|nr:homeodomain-like protein [Tanacetum cinerariifolium]